jgi:response regulator RpfG family c-di-GMP phosphodiesterase
MNYKILIVDDEPANLRLLERLFRREFQVLSAISGAEALELLEKHDVAVIISDQRMPGMTGIEFLKHAAETRAHTVRIILTGYTDVNSLVEALNSGVVYKYVTKPWVNEDLRQTVVRAVEHYETIKSQFQYKLQNERLTEDLNRIQMSSVQIIGEMLNLKDPFLHGHLQRVASYAIAIGYRLNLDSSDLEQLSLAAFLHEIGQILMPECITHKTSILNADEHLAKKLCAKRGAQMLTNIPGMNEIAVTISYHTERYDGKGFPDGLSNEQIPLFSRIIAVAKAYDEMTEPRHKNEILTHEETIEILRNRSEKQFDPIVVEAFCKIEAIGKIRRILSEGIVGMQLSGARIWQDEKTMSTSEVLQKFKTEPLLALDVLKAGNEAVAGEQTAQLMPLLSKLGETRLRSMIDRFGLPSAGEIEKSRTTRALRRAVAAQLLAAHSNILYPDDAYTLGLLWDIGEVLLANLFPNELLNKEGFEAKARPHHLTEIFGIDSARISRLMLEKSGVPKTLTKAIENQSNFMRLNHPSSLLMQIACKIADNETAQQISRANVIESSVLEILNLSRAELNKVYDRVNFISERHIEMAEPMLELFC